MTGLQIVAEPAEAASACALVAAYLDEVAARIPDLQRPCADDLGADLRPPHGVFLVARHDGEAVACAGLRRLAPDTAEIKRMWVAPPMRGRGIARAVLAELEARAAAWGCRWVVLDTNAALTEAVALYRSAGYRVVGAYNDNSHATDWFAKDLGGAGG